MEKLIGFLKPFSGFRQCQQYICDRNKTKKKILFVSCNGPKKNRVGRSVKIYFLV